MHVKIDGDEIVCTREHPFYVPVRGWAAACDLRAGDILVRSNGEYVVVEAIEHELLESPITVYNFEVEDFHTYHVGSASVLVHNKCNNECLSPENRVGTGSPKNNGTPNGTFTKVTDSGEVYSFTRYNADSQPVVRIDFMGRPHAGVLPHIHVYGYNESGQRNYSHVFTMLMQMID